MDRHGIALLLEEIGSLLEIAGENRFKAKAFTSAARAIEKADAEPAALVQNGGLESLAGIGPVTARVIRELVTTGRSNYYDDLRERTPAGLRDIMAVPGLGAKKAFLLYQNLGIATLQELSDAVDAGRIAEVKGFGERTQQKIATGLKFVRSGAGRRRLSRAVESADRLLGMLRALPGTQQIALAGELRRRLETVDGVDVIASADEAACTAAVDAFMAMPAMLHPVREAARLASARLADGLAIRFVCVPPESFAWALWLHTGSASHVAEVGALAQQRGFMLTPEGLQKDGALIELPDETALYNALRLQFVVPELREGRGEVAAAAAGGLPRLIDRADLRGTFHCHTTYSDGKATIAELGEAARERGWSYLGIADHSRNASYAGGLSVADLQRQQREIDAWNERHGNEVWLLKGVEADILADGQLDYASDPGVLDSFDYVIASVHSHFRMSKKEMTARLLRALDDPHLTILGHLTGRLLLSRDGYDVDVMKVITKAAERGVCIEINADPTRLDMDWRWWPAAKAAGVKCAINPDAHSVRGLDNVQWGVDMARKGGLEAGDVINTKDVAALRAFLAARHG